MQADPPDARDPAPDSGSGSSSSDPSAPTGALGSGTFPPPLVSSAGAPRFPHGATIAGRYRVRGFLGHGGMGEVYDVQDLELDERVALKTLRQQATRDAAAEERFKREIALARRITHPNVCRIFDLSYHGAADGPLPILTMELLAGETLSQRLHRAGAFAPGEALPVVAQIAAGLDAAHQAGVVHRDFKPSNVMIATDARGAARAVITDFGLARLHSGLRPGQTETASSSGTYMYMAPEQIEGREAGPATDLYAFGLVLFEIVTGRRPFEGPAAAAMLQRLKEPAPSPRQFTASLPLAWETVILRCLEADPARRFDAASEALSLLQRIEAGAAGRPAAARDPTQPTSVAVLPLRNLSEDATEDYLADGLTEGFIAALARVAGLGVTSRDSVMRYKGSGKPMHAIASELGVDHVLEGSVLRAGDQLALLVQLVDPASGATLWEDRHRGRIGSVPEFQQRVAEAVVRHAQIELAPVDRARLTQLQQVSADSYVLYLKGRFLQGKRQPEALLKAIETYQRVAERTPGDAQVWASMAECYHALGSFGYAIASASDVGPKAQAAAEKALALDPGSPEAHAILASTFLSEWRWQDAEAEFRMALEAAPSSANSLYQYARLLTALGRAREAIATATKARRLDPLSPIVSQAVAIAQYFAGDYRRAIAESEATLQLQPDFWLSHLVRGESHSRLGARQPADADLEAALAATSRNSYVLSAYGRHACRFGDAEAGRRALAELTERARNEHVSPSLFAKLAFALGDVDGGLAQLERAMAERDASMPFLRVDPDYESVRADARFHELLGALRLPPA